jgi:ATP-binding cassette subfamily B multidrug efflux pump
MDRLIVLEHGRIVEAGSHDELLRQDSHYAKLWRHQSGGFLPDELPVDTVALGDAPLIDEGPVDDMRAEEQPEPNTNDEPMPART